MDKVSFPDLCLKITSDDEHIKKAFVLAGLIMPDETLSQSSLEFGRIQLEYLRTPHALSARLIKPGNA